MKKLSSFLLALLMFLCYAGQVSATRYYVTPTGAGNKTGTDWNNASDDLASIINQGISDGDEFWLAKGTYINIGAIVISNTISIYGGFEGNETDLNSRSHTGWDFGSNATVIDATAICQDATVWTGDNRHIFAVANGNYTVAFDGLTFTNAVTDDRAPVIYGRGRIILSNVIVSNNTSTVDPNDQQPGGAITFNYATGSLTIENSKFENNTIVDKQRGGAVCLQTGTLRVSGSEFTGNSARNGGALFIYSSQTAIIGNSVFKNNTSKFEGGAIDSQGMLVVENSVFTGNTASDSNYGYGSAVYMRGGTFMLYNNVLANNNAGKSDGSAINGGSVTANNIFYGNTNGDVSGNIGLFRNNIIASFTPSVPSVPFSGDADFVASYMANALSGNITGTVDPDVIFNDAAAGDYTLKGGSPAIGAGIDGTDIGITGNAIAAQAAIGAISIETRYYYLMGSARTMKAGSTTAVSNNNYLNTGAGQLMSVISSGANLEQRARTETDKNNQLWKFIYNNGNYKLVSKSGFYIGYAGDQYVASIVDLGKTFTFGSNTANSQSSATGQWNITEFGASSINKNNNSLYYTTYGNSTTNDTGCAFQFIAEDAMPPVLDYSGATWYRIQASRRVSANKSLSDKGVDVNIAQEANADDVAQYWKITGDASSSKIASYNGLEVKGTGTGDRFVSGAAGTGDDFQTVYAGAYAYQFKSLTTVNSSWAHLNDYQGTAVCYYSADDAGAYFTVTPVAVNAVTVTTDGNINGAMVTIPTGAPVGSAFDVPLNAHVTLTYQVESGYVPVVTVNGATSSAGTLENGTYTLTVSNITAATTVAISATIETYLPTVIVDDAPVRYYNLQGIEVSTPEKGNIYIVRQGANVKKVVY